MEISNFIQSNKSDQYCCYLFSFSIRKMITTSMLEGKFKLVPKWTQPVKILNVQDRSQGVDQDVKVVDIMFKRNKENQNQKVIVKVPLREKEKIMNEVIGCQFSHQLSIPAPQVFYHDDDCLIQQFKGEKTLKKINTSKKSFKNIYKNLGVYLKKLHSKKGKEFDKIQYKNLKETEMAINKKEKQIEESIFDLQSLEFYGLSFIKKIKKYFEFKKHLLNKISTCLLHGDYSDDNIISDEKKVKAIIDFGDLCLGPAMQDFSRMFVDHFDSYKFASLLEGYGEHNLEEINFYVFVLLLWLMSAHIKSGKFRGRLRRFEKVLKHILDEIN